MSEADAIPRELERLVESELDAARVWQVDSCGWRGDNDPDPEFIGHAMWATDQPLFGHQLDYRASFGEVPVRRRPSDIEREILTLGEDFGGLMAVSRLSIGLALVWRRRARANVLNESAFFWLHHMDAILKLAMASDRIRDLLIVACTGEGVKRYEPAEPSELKGLPAAEKKAGKRRALYATPFRDAGSLLTARGLQDDRLVDPLASLPGFAAQLFEYKRRRNSIVHEIATRVSKRAHDHIAKLQTLYDQQQVEGFFPLSPDHWLSDAGSAETRLQAEIDRAVEDLVSWYIALLRTSSAVLEVEYWSRVLGASGRAR